MLLEFVKVGLNGMDTFDQLRRLDFMAVLMQVLQQVAPQFRQPLEVMT